MGCSSSKEIAAVEESSRKEEQQNKEETSQDNPDASKQGEDKQDGEKQEEEKDKEKDKEKEKEKDKENNNGGGSEGRDNTEKNEKQDELEAMMADKMSQIEGENKSNKQNDEEEEKIEMYPSIADDPDKKAIETILTSAGNEPGEEQAATENTEDEIPSLDFGTKQETPQKSDVEMDDLDNLLNDLNEEVASTGALHNEVNSMSTNSATSPASMSTNMIYPPNGETGTGLFCINCDFKVIKHENGKWESDVDYLYFRNTYPETVSKKLKQEKGSTAYCCQCKWVDTTVQRPVPHKTWVKAKQ